MARAAARGFRRSSGSRRPRSRASRTSASRASRSASTRICARAATPSSSASSSARRRASAARAPARPADARALPLGAPGRGARRLPGGAQRARRGARDRAGPRAAGAAPGDPPPGPRARRSRRSSRRPRARSRARRIRGPQRELAVCSARRSKMPVRAAGGSSSSSGEPGIGKSRLADELVTRARECGAEVLFGRCWEAGGAPAYWPWMQALRVYICESRARGGARRSRPGRGRARAVAARASRDPAGLAGARPRRLGGRALPPLRRDCRSSSGARRHAGRSCWCSTICMPPTRRRCCSCSFSPASSAASRLLVLGAFRDVDPLPSAALAAMLAEVAREPGTRRVPLGGLSEAGGRQLRGADCVGDRLARVRRGAPRGNGGQPAVRGRNGAPASRSRASGQGPAGRGGRSRRASVT